MAIAYDNATKGGQTSGTPASITFSHTVNSNKNGLLFVAVKGDGANGQGTMSQPTITYNNVSMIYYTDITGDVNSGHLWVFYLVAPTSGANNVVITQGATGAQFLAGTAVSYTGVSQIKPLDATGTTSTTSAGEMTVTATTTLSNDWGVYFVGGGGRIAASTNSTQRLSAVATPWDWIGDTNNVQNPPGSKSMAVTVSLGDSTSCIGIIVCIKATHDCKFITNNIRPRVFGPGLGR